MAYQTEGFDFNEHIDRVIEYAQSIEYGKVTVLTGPNGYGKSLLRKLISVESPDGTAYKPASVSMAQRTNKNHNFDALGGLLMDQSDDATSNHTSYVVKMLFKSKDDRYLVIDEPEIGMGREVLLGLINYIKQQIELRKQEGRFRGILIITHSDFFIDNFEHDAFINMEGMTYQEWKNRKIEAIDPDDLKKWCLEMWRAIEKRIKEKSDKR